MPQFLKYGAALIAGGFYIWAIIILLNNDNWVGISALTTMLLAIAAFLAIRQNYSLHKRERKERLLNEIIDWVTEIQTISLDVNIPVTDRPFTKLEAKRIEANVLLRYGIPFSKNEYIRAIVCEAFKEELQNDVENIINTFTVFMLLKGKAIGMKNIKESFGGTALKIMEDVEKQINEGEKTIDQLLDECISEFSTFRTILLSKTGNIMSSL